MKKVFYLEINRKNIKKKRFFWKKYRVEKIDKILEKIDKMFE